MAQALHDDGIIVNGAFYASMINAPQNPAAVVNRSTGGGLQVPVNPPQFQQTRVKFK